LLLVGLGNPGPKYHRTRHNAGALAIERAAARWRVPLREIGEVRIGKGESPAGPVLLAGPVGWMNVSGPPVRVFLDKEQLTPADLIVVHDDLDLPVGRLRVRQDGGAGGHNGLASLLSALSTPEFCRIKIGIGRPAPPIDPADYVLARFTNEEWPVIEQALDAAVDALECVLRDGAAAAMNRFNVREKAEPETES